MPNYNVTVADLTTYTARAIIRTNISQPVTVIDLTRLRRTVGQLAPTGNN